MTEWMPRSPIPHDPEEAKLLFEALRHAERRLGINSEDTEIANFLPATAPTWLRAATWSLPVDDRYNLWIWTMCVAAPVTRLLTKVKGTYAVDVRSNIEVHAAITPTSGEWFFGPFHSIDSIQVINWILDAGAQDLYDARQRSVQTSRGRHLQRKAVRMFRQIPEPKLAPKAKRQVAKLIAARKPKSRREAKILRKFSVDRCPVPSSGKKASQ